MKNKYELWDKYVSPETRKKQVITQLKGESTIVINIVTEEKQNFISLFFIKISIDANFYKKYTRSCKVYWCSTEYYFQIYKKE